MAAKSENYSHILPPLSTKREQYKAFRKMKLSKLTDVNTYCRCALKTTPTVNRTIEHFSQEISELAGKRSTLLTLDICQIERLKCCSKSFSLIIRNCPKYSHILSDIKRGYDSYLETILRSVEQEQLDTKTRQSHDRSCDKRDVIQQVKVLELAAMELIKENDKLQEVLAREMEDARAELPINTPTNRSDSVVGIVDYSDHVTHLQQQIYDQRMKAQASISQRSGHVPLSVCQNLEQCIRSTELHIQQLKKQNSTLCISVRELEKKLHNYFEYLKSSQHDIKLLWETIQENATKTHTN